MKIKICGLKYPENIVELGQLLPDYMGFIFWDKSARFFDGIIPAIPKSIKKVGVFVDASLDEIIDKIRKHDLQAVQLHGRETAEFCQELKKNIPNRIEIIKVFSILNTFEFDKLLEFEKVADFFLFDTKGKLPGGNGSTFDWKVLKKYPSSKPFFLSGGIGVEEIESLNEILNIDLPIYVVDVNSKLEIEPGLKNVELCKSMVAYVKKL